MGFIRYLLERKQFGAPLAALQINQEKLVRMLGNIQAMFLLGWRLCKVYEAGKMTPGQASLCKVFHTIFFIKPLSIFKWLVEKAHIV